MSKEPKWYEATHVVGGVLLPTLIVIAGVISFFALLPTPK